MGQPGHGIDADMRFHPEELLIPFPGLLHLWITLFGLVLGGRRHRHNGGVNDSALTHEQALFSQTGIDLFEDPLSQCMLLKQMAKAKQRGRVGNTLAKAA